MLTQQIAPQLGTYTEKRATLQLELKRIAALGDKAPIDRLDELSAKIGTIVTRLRRSSSGEGGCLSPRSYARLVALIRIQNALDLVSEQTKNGFDEIDVLLPGDPRICEIRDYLADSVRMLGQYALPE